MNVRVKKGKGKLAEQVAQKIFRLLSVCACAPFLPGLAVAQGTLSAESLDSLLSGALHAFSSGDFSTAADRFQRMQRDFGGEAVFENPAFLHRVLPLKGTAELQSGAPGRAIETFETYLARFAGNPGGTAHVLYSLATAYRQNNQPNEALQQFEAFVAIASDPVRSSLATLQRAEILISLGRSTEAFDLLHQFSHSGAPPTLLVQARLFAASEAMKENRLDLAAQFLLHPEQDIAGVPEVAVLTFSAIELGDRLAEAGQAAEAIRIYRLALPREALIAEQTRRIQTLLAALSPHSAPLEGAWSSYLRTLLERMQKQLSHLRTSEDHTASLTLRRGQALLMAGRHREAWLLFESLAMEPSLPADLRSEAQYRWILAAGGLEQWEEALAVARNFTLRYPQSDLAPTAFYLIAQAHRERHRYPEAIEVLSDLVTQFPDHPLHPRWLFERGLSHTFLGQYSAARADFVSARERHREGSVAASADFWHALTHFLEGNYAAALAEWDHLAEVYRGNALEGEILYRRAATLYAAHDLENGLHQARSFIRQFPRHSRYGEARLLEGEILAGSGRPEEALLAYQKVPSDREAIYVHALFQGGKLLRALHDYEALVQHFTAYIEREEANISARISEALYWVGWAHSRMGEPEKARRLFRETLQLHGNHREAREIQTILKTLSRLGSDGEMEGNFAAWLEAEREDALERKHFTWFARLTLYLAQTEIEDASANRSKELLLEIAGNVLPGQLDAACLGAVGHALLEQDPALAENHFMRLLEDFPASPERADAFFGLGILAFERGEPALALSWLRRMEDILPPYPRAAEAALLAGEASMQTKDYAGAVAFFESVLLMRSARGRPHAAALRGMGEALEAQGQTERSIAAYQRITILYHAYPELVAEAYFHSGRLLDKRGDPEGAYRTFNEMLGMPSLEGSSFLRLAEEEKEKVRTRIPVPAQESP